MKKSVLLTIGLLVIIIGSLSGCIDDISNAASDTGTCCVLGVIGIVLFIILIAYLLGGKKTVVQTQQSASAPYHPAPIIIEKESRESPEKEVSDRRCPSCGRVIPEGAKICPYCGKKFKSHFEEEEEFKGEKKEEEKTRKQLKEEIKPPKHCSECGHKFEEEDLDFCPKCGVKLK